MDADTVRGNEGDFRPSVMNCVANDVTTTPATDVGFPAPGGVYYFLVRVSDTGASNTWSPVSNPPEKPGAGTGNRDSELDSPPAPNSCANNPP